MNIAVPNAPQSDAQPSDAAKTILFGRYMRPDQQEFPCQVASIDTSHVSLVTSGEGEVGETIVAYLDEIGRLEGRLIQKTEVGFTIGLTLTAAQSDRIQKRLDWINKSGDDEGLNHRRHARFEPKESASHLILPDGRTYPGEILDISISGAAVRVDVIPAIGTYVMLGKMRGRVTRIHSDGIGIEFVKMLDTNGLKSSIDV